jgi:signal transduction histidine kinase
MEPLSVSVLQKRLKRTSWFPLAIIGATLLFAVAFILKDRFDERIGNMRYALGDVLESQKELLGQEILLNQPQAVLIRVDLILANWRRKYPSVQACIGVSYRQPDNAIGMINRCAVETESPEMAFSRVPGGMIQVGTDGQSIATIRHTVVRPTQAGDLFPPILIATFVLAVFIALFSHRWLVRQVERTVLNPLLDKITSDQRDAAVAETAKILAHEIRRPFQSLRLALKSMLDSPNSDVRNIGTEICADVEGSIRSMNAMLQDVLDAHRELALNKEDLSLTKAIGGVVESVLKFHPEVSVTTVQGFKHRKMVVADREKVARVITNMVENAVQAMGNQGTLEIRTSDVTEGTAPQVKVSILNSGTAIRPEHLGQLFSPFFTKRAGGTGLGLWISKKIVETHGGRIGCRSTPEQLTEFWFTLPAATVDEASAILEVRGRGMEKIHEQSILVFDDERSVHSHWRQYAAKHDYHTLCHFMSWDDFVAQDAFSLAKDAIAFVDIQFKNSKHDGFDIARSLRQLGVRRIYAITSAIELARESGLFDEVFGKEVPTDFAALIA